MPVRRPSTAAVDERLEVEVCREDEVARDSGFENGLSRIVDDVTERNLIEVVAGSQRALG